MWVCIYILNREPPKINPPSFENTLYLDLFLKAQSLAMTTTLPILEHSMFDESNGYVSMRLGALQNGFLQL
jgi:hypothetical protein